jgi:D-glycero-alpha-D-manno-heptose-7-phosphate kinase
MKLLRTINAMAPIRVNDLGGWTDTWFAERGKVLNFAVYPWVEVQVRVFLNSEKKRERVVIHQENYHETFAINPEAPATSKNPMIEAAFAMIKIPHKLFLDVTVFSGVPAGASTGTSAAVSVCLLGALCHLTEKKLSPYEIAYMAHRLETEMLKLQSGIQDQLCSALGGVNYIDMYQYPRAHISPVVLPDSISLELENRLVLIFLGQGHVSSDLHKKVIENLEEIGPDNPLLARLKKLVDRGKENLVWGDLEAFGKVMSENTEIQRELHPELISEKADEVIQIAREFKSLGWKVNGAGGNGGSLTILAGAERSCKRKMIQEIEKRHPDVQHNPVLLSQKGLTVWESREKE